VLFEGDGSLLMHIHELEMVQRHGIKLLICVLNDGAYGSEIHKLHADGIDDGGAVFGRTDIAAIAKGFGLRGANMTDVSQLKGCSMPIRRRARPKSGLSTSPTRCQPEHAPHRRPREDVTITAGARAARRRATAC
jgi:thiamine pyrophosphate-dependent acetolactate synthase large subunit-like protein